MSLPDELRRTADDLLREGLISAGHLCRDAADDIEALRADAERYRHLRAKHVVESPNDGELCIHYVCDFDHYNDPDASIDAALAQAKDAEAL